MQRQGFTCLLVFEAAPVEMNVRMKFILTEVSLLIWGSVIRTARGNGCVVHDSHHLQPVINNIESNRCTVLEGRTGSSNSNISFQVQKECIKTSMIEIEVTLLGHHVCSNLKLLFVPRDEPETCPWKQMCKGKDVTKNQMNGTTICLMTCPKSKNSPDKYPVELIHRFQAGNLTICGINFKTDECWSNPCLNGGTCVDGDYSVTCQCPTGYVDWNCATQRLNCSNPWCTLNPWTVGEIPDYCVNFSNPGEFYLRFGAVIVPGWVGMGVQTDGVDGRVDSGDLSGYSCFPVIETCGHNGASLTTWINIIDCPDHAGVLTSRDSGTTTGIVVSCNHNRILFQLMDLDHYYGTIIAGTPGGWFHLTIVYQGKGNGFKVYYDGVLKHFQPFIFTLDLIESSGRMVIGRKYISTNNNYAAVMVDELTLWNNY